MIEFLNAPDISDSEDQIFKGEHHRIGGFGLELGSSLSKRPPNKGAEWPYNSDSTSSTNKCKYNCERVSTDSTKRNCGEYFDRESHEFRAVGDDFDGLDECLSESDEQPAELVPLGMRTLNFAAYKKRSIKRKNRVFSVVD
ncbi:unnamed protein product [Dracunculus medinensis]|uniref:Ovule protein n=1 Tax=Dracunculus medinensis TaxID=318479 RepID=A0A0N4U3C2_DRAME|nr:unnamed protein product [Dracunculus medinensis]